MVDLVVFGVTGDVGFSVAKHLSKTFRIHGVCYDVNQERQSVLSAEGVAVSKFDRKSLSDVTRGVKFAFVTTKSSFTDNSSHKHELEEGMAIADACKTNDVTHVVYMTQHHVANAIGLSARQADAKVIRYS